MNAGRHTLRTLRDSGSLKIVPRFSLIVDWSLCVWQLSTSPSSRDSRRRDKARWPPSVTGGARGYVFTCLSSMGLTLTCFGWLLEKYQQQVFRLPHRFPCLFVKKTVGRAANKFPPVGALTYTIAGTCGSVAVSLWNGTFYRIFVFG